MSAKSFFLVALALSAVCRPALCDESTASTGPTLLTLRVKSPWVAQAVEQAGGRRLADYGSFSLMECDAATAESFSGSDLVEVVDAYRIKLRTGSIDTALPSTATTHHPPGEPAGKGLRLVQLVGPVQPAWYQALTATGVQVITYIPENAYLVYGDAGPRENLRLLTAGSAFIRWEGAYLPIYKNLAVLPGARPQGPGPMLFTVQLVRDPSENAVTLQLIESLRTGRIQSSYPVLRFWNLVVALPEDRLADVVSRPDVVCVNRFDVPTLLDEAQGIIVAGLANSQVPTPGYLDWLTRMGFTQEQFDTSGFVVDVADNGIDNGTVWPSHFGLYVGGRRPGTSRVVYSRFEGEPIEGTLSDCEGHGSINAHIIGGYNDLNGYPDQDARGLRYGLGIAPFTRLGASIIFDPLFTYPNYPDMLSRAYRDGARIVSNSWGSVFDHAYSEVSQAYDALVRDAQPAGSASPESGNQEMVILFAAGNAGPLATTIGSQAAAKNVIVIGAAENLRRLGGQDGCAVDDTQADNPEEIALFQSRGPTPDGRFKPDLVAPGTHITGGLIQQPTYGALGAVGPCFDGSGVCGGVFPDIFFPPGQQLYTSSSGTSHSCPAAAGGAALIRQFFLNQGRNTPSPAMTKCLLINSARYMTGIDANDTLPSPHQGMGGMDLGEAFARGTTLASILRDQLPEDVLTSSGQTRVYNGTVLDPARPLRVTLAWTDAPGSPIGAVERNDLDLVVITGGQSYRGNEFAGAWSVPGTTADRKNNVESVFLPPGTAGPVTITVEAANINSDGVPEVGTPLDQDFALIAHNLVESGSIFITATDCVLTGESCLPFNNLPDQGETLTLALSLSNAGPVDATGISAALMVTDKVAPLSDLVPYGLLPAGGPAVSASFYFRLAGSCGDEVWLFWRMWNHSQDLGVIQVRLPDGAGSPVFSESFDALQAPALPAGWTESTQPANGQHWQSTNVDSDSPPQAVGITLSAGGTTSELISPPVTLHRALAELSFRQRYSLSDGTSGQLLISTGTEPPRDVLSMGGTFHTGSYNGFVPAAPGGYWAWTSDSGSWMDTTIRLPPAAVGRTVRLHWRVNSVGSIAGTWYVDTVSITDRSPCCDLPAVASLEGPSVSGTRTGPVAYTVFFTEPVIGFDSLADIRVHATGNAAVGAVTFTGTGMGPYHVELAQLTGQGTLSISIAENGCTDADGNGNPASGLSPPVLVDHADIACSVSRLDANPINALEVRFNISFSEPVYGFTTEDLLLDSSVNRAVLGRLEGGPSDYQIRIYNIVGDGTICLQIPAGAAGDEFGNTHPFIGPVCYTINQIHASTRFNYQLAATSLPSAVSSGSLPATLSELSPGSIFYMEIWARQEKREDSGITCAYADLSYQPALLDPLAESPDARFAESLFLGRSTQTSGLIGEIGGCSLDDPQEREMEQFDWLRVAKIQMRALPPPCEGGDCAPATVQVALAPAQAESAAYGEGVVPPNQILFGQLQLLIHVSTRTDLDRDGDVDLDDVALFELCRSGPALPVTANCEQADFDLDGDGDQTDFGMLQRCYGGAGIPPSPECEAVPE
jgi:hypothetical protein